MILPKTWLRLAATTAVLACPGIASAQAPLQALPSILQLQLSQRPAWRAYKDAAADIHADGAQAASRAALLNAMKTPQRLDALRTELQRRQQVFEQQATATRAFYAVLSPEQRHIFDDVTRIPEPPNFPPQSSRRPQQSASAWSQNVLRSPPPGAGLTPPAP